jgi:hypothetical protein
MSQKSNLQTIRPFFRSSNLFNLSNTYFLKSLNFLSFLKFFFNKKFFVPIDVTLNFVGARAVFSIVFYSRTVKIIRFSRRLRFLKSYVKCRPSFINFVLDNLQRWKINLISIKFTLVNKVFSHLKKSRFLQVLFLTHRSFRDSVFVRRDGLFFDYLKIVFLFSKGVVNSRILLFFLSEIFKYLPKYKHIKFISLLKKTFNILVDPVFFRGSDKISIHGIKFSIAGKFKGKLRKSRVSIQVGKVPVQSISKDVEFSKINVFTRYGVFGLKLWIYRK